MPTMIPPKIPSDAELSEQDVFEILKRAPQAGEWLILHSFQVENPKSRVMPREIDFVVLIPDLLAVVCLEVKGGSFKIENREWFRQKPLELVDPSPPRQCETAMFALKDKHPRYFHKNSPLSLGCAVVFNHASSPEDGELPTTRAKLIWSSDVDKKNPDKLAKSIMSHAHEMFENRKKLVDEKNIKLGQFLLNALREELEPPPMEIASRPDTIFRSDLETLRPQLLRMTSDQSNALRRVGLNDRCVIDGAAGTGKTVLALELAKQRGEEAGETVALLCSNPYLSRRFERWASTLPGGQGGRVIAGTPATLPLLVFKENPEFVSRHQQRLESLPQLDETLKQGYLDNEWGPFIEGMIEDLGQGGIFDYLIVDEAQNLCDEMFLKMMDALLKGGLASGRWTMFGDFTNQNIVCSTLRNGMEALRSRGLNWSNDVLETNCRNTQEIAQTVAELVGIVSPPITGVHGPLVQIEYFETLEDLGNLLDRLITGFRGRDFYSRQIILLTSGSGEEFDSGRSYGGWKLLNIRDAEESARKTLQDREDVPSISGDSSPKTVRYSDVYDFQGLESELAILVLPVTDRQTVVGGGVTLPREKHLRRVLYTGMSRAKTMLVVVAHETYRRTIELRQMRNQEVMRSQT